MSGNTSNEIEITLKQTTETNAVPMPSSVVEEKNISNKEENKSEDGAKTEEKVDDVELLKSQLFQIFSLDNFSKDKFLISQLDSDQYISVEVIAQLKAIKPPSHNIPLILDILKTFPNLQVDPSNTRVRLMAPRSIIILREVPQSTPQEMIEKLFEGDDCPHCVRCEYAGNENWYISFVSEEQAHKAYNHLREKVQTFLGKHIMARIKTSSTFICSNNPPLVSVLPFDPPLHPYVPSHNNVPFFQSEMLHPWSPKILLEPYQLKQRAYQEGMMMNPVLMPKNFEDVSPSPGSHNSSGNQFYQPQPFYHPAYKPSHNYNEHHNFTEAHNHNKNEHKRSEHNNRYPGHENKPPPRFLRQQMSANFQPYSFRHRNDSHYSSKQDQHSDHSSREYPASSHSNPHRGPPKWTVKAEVSTATEAKTTNNPPTSANSHPPTHTNPQTPSHNHNNLKDINYKDNRHRDTNHKDINHTKHQDTNQNYHRKKFSERRGSYRSGRKGKDDAKSNYKGQQQKQNKSEGKEVVSFKLETNSFPPLPSLHATTEDTQRTELKQVTEEVSECTSTIATTTSTTASATVFCNKLQASYVQVLNLQQNNNLQQTLKQHSQQQLQKPTLQDLKNSSHKPLLGNEKRVSVTIRPSNKSASTSNHHVTSDHITTSDHTIISDHTISESNITFSHNTSNNTTSDQNLTPSQPTSNNNITPTHTTSNHSLYTHQQNTITTNNTIKPSSTHAHPHSKETKSISAKETKLNLPVKMSYAQVAQKTKSSPECNISHNNKNNSNTSRGNSCGIDSRSDEGTSVCSKALKSLRLTDGKNAHKKQPTNKSTTNNPHKQTSLNKQSASISNKDVASHQTKTNKIKEQQIYSTKLEKKRNNAHNTKPQTAINNGLHNGGDGDDDNDDSGGDNKGWFDNGSGDRVGSGGDRVGSGGSVKAGVGDNDKIGSVCWGDNEVGGDDTDEYDYENYEGVYGVGLNGGGSGGGGKGGKKTQDGVVVNGDDKNVKKHFKQSNNKIINNKNTPKNKNYIINNKIKINTVCSDKITTDNLNNNDATRHDPCDDDFEEVKRGRRVVLHEES